MSEVLELQENHIFKVYIGRSTSYELPWLLPYALEWGRKEANVGSDELRMTYRCR